MELLGAFAGTSVIAPVGAYPTLLSPDVGYTSPPGADTSVIVSVASCNSIAVELFDLIEASHVAADTVLALTFWSVALRRFVGGIVGRGDTKVGLESKLGRAGRLIPRIGTLASSL